MINKLNQKLNSDLHFKELMKGSTSTFVLKIIGMVIGFGTSLFITNYYGASVYGTLGILSSVVTVFSIFPGFGMGGALIRIVGELRTHSHYNEVRHICKKVLLWTTLSATFFAFLLFISSDFIAQNILEKPNLSSQLQLISMVLIFSTVTGIISAILQSMKKIKLCVFNNEIVRKIIMPILIGIGYLLAVLDKSSENLVTIYIISVALTCIVSIIFVSKLIKNLPIETHATEKYKYNFKKIITIASPLFFAGIFMTIMNLSDVVMLGIYTTEKEVGVYIVAKQMAMLIGIILASINSIAFPKFIEFHAKNDRQGLVKIAQQSAKVMFFAAFPLLLLYLIFPSFVMGIFGAEFIIGTTVLITLSMAQFINVISGSVGGVMTMTDYRKEARTVSAITALMVVSLHYFLIPLYGINGAAAASAIGMVFWNITLSIYVKRKLGFWTFYLPFVRNFKKAK